MSDNSKIQWTHATFNPWRGCARVSPGCEHCYAETWAKRNPAQFGTWGVGGTRVVASESMWREPIKWDKRAFIAGERHRVFCASLADVGEDRPDIVAPRTRLCELIVDTPNLDWLLLTKRIENMQRLFPQQILERCWVGVTAEDQQRADERIPQLLATPAAVRFVSYEPALGPVDFAKFMFDYSPTRAAGYEYQRLPDGERIDWIIVGGESGHGARPFKVEWARSAVMQGAAADVPVFVKQLGAQPTWGGRPVGYYKGYDLKDKKGGDMSEWPDDLRVREFPCAS